MQNAEQTIEQLRAENQDLRDRLDRALRQTENYRKALEKHLPVYEEDETELEEILKRLDEQQSPSEFLHQTIAELNHGQ